MKVLVFGAGYVGLPMALLLSKKYKVSLVENNEEKLNSLKDYKFYLPDKDFKKYSKAVNELDIISSIKNLNIEEFIFSIICVPTNFDSKTNLFDTSIVKNVIEEILLKDRNHKIIIRSTVPIGFTEEINKEFKTKNIVFSPEFLREGYAFEDSIYPMRIVSGSYHNEAINNEVLDLFESITEQKTETIKCSCSEAEAIKLFSNSYLAMRVAYFNELDTFAIAKKLNSKLIIKGVSLDNRIGNYHNNPSFGYGGYCLPKDSKQLLSNFSDIPQSIISSIIESNNLRKTFLAEMILKKEVTNIGIYKLNAKKETDNFKESAIIDLIKIFEKKSKINIYIYEPSLNEEYFEGFKVLKDFQVFNDKVDIILANRISEELNEAQEKVFSRDIFNVS